MRGGRVLAGTAVSTPRAFAVSRGEAGVAAFHDRSDAAGGRIVVVALVEIAEGIDGLFVAVAVVVADDDGVGAVRVHAHGGAADPHLAVVALLPGDFLRHVIAADAEGLARLVGELRAAVAVIEIPQAVRTGGQAVQAVVVLATGEAGEQHVAFVDARFEHAVAVGVGVDQQIRRLRDHDLITEHGDTERCSQERLLHEHRGLVGHAVQIGVLQHDDAIAFLLTIGLAAVVHAFGDVHPTLRIEVDVGRVVQQRRGRPQRHFEFIRRSEELRRHHGDAAVDGVLLRSLGVNAETHRGTARLATAIHATVVDRHFGGEAHHAGRQVIGDHRRGMRADALLVGLAVNFQRPVIVGFVDACFAIPGDGGFPRQRRQVLARTIGHHQFWLDPIRPVAADVSFVAHRQVEFLGVAQRDVDVDQAGFVCAGQHRTFEHGFDHRRGCFTRRVGWHRCAGLGAGELRFAVGLHRRGRDGGELAGLRQFQPRRIRPLLIEVGVEVVLAERRRLHAGLGHLDLRRPHDGVECEGTETVHCPVAVIVAAGETDAATAVSAFDAPHQRLRLVEPGDAVLVPQVDVLLHPLAGGNRGDQIQHLGSIGGKAHVVIEFVVGLDRSGHTAGHRMIGQRLEVRHPVRIHRPAFFESPADPRPVILLAFRR